MTTCRICGTFDAERAAGVCETCARDLLRFHADRAVVRYHLDRETVQ